MIDELRLLDGLPIRVQITANMASHGYNRALVERLHQAILCNSGVRQ